MTIDMEPPTLRHRGREESSSSSSPAPPLTHTLLDTAKAVEGKVERALLLAWDELPAWRRDNAFITTGYRPTSHSYRRSLASVLAVHNESVNIWTHLLGAVVFVALGATAALVTLAVLAPPRWYHFYNNNNNVTTATATDVLVLACFFTGAFLCLGMSATYHALCNHSPAVAKWGNKLDYTGIVFLIVGSYMPALYYGFYCLPHLMEVYLSGIWLLGLGCLVVSWFEYFRTPAWRPYRAMMFVGLGVSGVVPVIHGLTIYGFRELDERMGLRWILLEGFLYILGAVIYAARWPERSASQKFDIWGSSHQIFHVLILFAAASHLYGTTRAFDFHHGALGARC